MIFVGLNQRTDYLTSALSVFFTVPVTQNIKLILGFVSIRLKIIHRTDGKELSAIAALPYRQWRAPIPLSGKRPVLALFKPLTESALFNVFRYPVNFAVVL